MEKRPVAVFDIDGTVFRSSLFLDLADRLIERGVFPETARETFEEDRLKWLDRKGDYRAYVQKVVEAFHTHLKGASYEEVTNIAGEIIEERRNRVYRYTRDLIKDLKEKGYFLLAISHSPKFIVDGFGYETGFDKTYGIYYTTGASERFTGDIQDEELIFNKASILQRAVLKENLTLEKSVGVGDTETDIPMLELVETAIAFNPNEKLYKHAKWKGWKIVVERKDVIYEL